MRLVSRVCSAAKRIAICSAARATILTMMLICSAVVRISIDGMHMEARANWLKCGDRDVQNQPRNKSMEGMCFRS